jgi:hypothetical protein
MVKVNFFKTMKNNMSLKKILIILGLLSVIIVILFSCVNNYSIENFKPKSNIKAEIYLWVGPYGSLENDLVRRWLDFTKEYGNTPNIKLGRGKASEFTKYLELDKYPELNLNTNKALEPLKSVDLTKDNKLVPFVTIFFVGVQEGKAYKNPLGLATDKDVTYDNLSKSINFLSAFFYDSLYENDVNVVPAPPAAPPAPRPVPASTASTAPAAAPAIPKMPWA